ncbi:DUF1566 domain-containing protein [Desulfobacterales bacterium HSG2]|nr:DUF1566 domain-containing protein [Desulfobacterales bacterium HSG2]
MDRKYIFAITLSILGLIIGVMDWIGFKPWIGYEIRLHTSNRPQPEPRPGPQAERRVTLRSRPRMLSKLDVKNMLVKYNFFDKYKNKSGDFENDFVDNRNATVTDRATGLMWQWPGLDDMTYVETRAYIMTYEEAQAYVMELNRNKFAGYSNWRLPTIEELMSLMESKEVDGRYIDPVFKFYWHCWSADKYSFELVWYARFDFGGAYLDGFKDNLPVRVVRFR